VATHLYSFVLTLLQIQSQVPIFCGRLKVVARKLVPDAYGFIAIETFENPTRALISAMLEKNRARVEKITKTYIYTVSSRPCSSSLLTLSRIPKISPPRPCAFMESSNVCRLATGSVLTRMIKLFTSRPRPRLNWSHSHS
jgi:hypothetical protein